jgi:hypothetical protein
LADEWCNVAPQILHDNVTLDFKMEQGAANPSEWLDVEVHRPFDIEHRSPFRVRLLAVSDGYAIYATMSLMALRIVFQYVFGQPLW